MKTTLLIVWLCVSAMPAFAQTSYRSPSYPSRPAPCASVRCASAPAPLIGLGVPVVLAVGGVLVGAKLVRRRYKS
jgi:hypothetical protein